MKKKPDELSTARHLYRSRDYRGVIRILASQIFIYRDEPEYYRMMGVASLHIGDFSAAQSYFLRGLDLLGQDRIMLEGLAVTSLHRGEATEAVRLWLLIKDLYPRDNKAVLGLRLVQESPDRADWGQILKKEESRPIFPEAPFYWQRILRRSLFISAVLMGVMILAGATVWVVRTMQERQEAQFKARMDAPVQRPASAASSVDNGAPFPKTDYELTKTHLNALEIAALLDEMRTSFNQYRDNKVRLCINRILLSDADEASRQQALSLVSHIHEANFTNFKDPTEYPEVAREPWLYQGVYVRWTGKISGLNVGRDRIQFDLLPGYDNGHVSESPVPVSLYFPVELRDGTAIELIGSVEIDPRSKGKFSLRGTSIRLIRSQP